MKESGNLGRGKEAAAPLDPPMISVVIMEFNCNLHVWKVCNRKNSNGKKLHYLICTFDSKVQTAIYSQHFLWELHSVLEFQSYKDFLPKVNGIKLEYQL